ncbi:hypothetical protein GMST_16670 [Geomonas silvestris]|uniref:Glycosyltransferase 2-like domain-containing protein n=1 Tax=Geomonas silvestris TaxID=2740184 RepID=A0A6V8MHA6_9BACT|nr:glycosyltransferase [Geomonas silvestris]GFO59342.1 hypothetical protein GMST_16670 [Geomonas silvestris]
MNQAPLVSFVILAYNQEQLVREAVKAAFAQTYTPLEIIISDDCSTDGTFQVLRELAAGYRGPHQVRVRRSPVNRGLTGHLQDLVNEALGELVVVAAGDDIALPERTQALAECWTGLGSPPAVLYSDFEPVDAELRPSPLPREEVYPGPHTLERMARGRVGVLGATCALTRNLVTDFPPVLSSVIHEDRVFPYRALLVGGCVAYVNRRLLRYRVVGGLSATATGGPRSTCAPAVRGWPSAPSPTPASGSSTPWRSCRRSAGCATSARGRSPTPRRSSTSPTGTAWPTRRTW